LREALVNVLVHADYSDRASVLIVKRPDMFGFRNPGTMRIPVEIAMKGGEADCRNRLLHQMFRYIGLGEQSGSGIPKILEGWKLSHWRPPQLSEKLEPYDQTLMELRMLDLFPHNVVAVLREALGHRYEALGHAGQVAMALAFTERTLTHERLAQLTDVHPADLSRVLHRLVHDEGLLTVAGSGRGAVYHLTGLELPHPDDVFGKSSGSPYLAPGSPHNDASSPHLAPSSPHSVASSPDSTASSPYSAPEGEVDGTRDALGRLVSPLLKKGPVVDRLELLAAEELARLHAAAAAAREKRRLHPSVMRDAITRICSGQYVTIGVLAQLVQRRPKSLQSQYLTPMVKEEHVLEWAFPTKRNDPRQAYIAATPEGTGRGREEDPA